MRLLSIVGLMMLLAAPALAQPYLLSEHLACDGVTDDSAALQDLLDAVEEDGGGLVLADRPGVCLVHEADVGDNTTLAGHAGVVFRFNGGSGDAVLNLVDDRPVLRGVTVDGGNSPALDELVSIKAGAVDAVVDGVRLQNAKRGVLIFNASAVVANSQFVNITDEGMRIDTALPVSIEGNRFANIGNRGVYARASTKQSAKLRVMGNDFENVDAVGGGTGERGNAIQLFNRSNAVIASNTVRDVAFSCFRSNDGDNVTVTGNLCRLAGEKAIYVELGAVGATITGNYVQDALVGIDCTNLNDGGRNCVIDGNHVEGIGDRGIVLEGHGVISDNHVIDAPIGIMVGTNAFQEESVVSGNLIRDDGAAVLEHCVLVSSHQSAAPVVVQGNTCLPLSGSAVFEKPYWGHTNKVADPGTGALTRNIVPKLNQPDVASGDLSPVVAPRAGSIVIDPQTGKLWVGEAAGWKQK